VGAALPKINTIAVIDFIGVSLSISFVVALSVSLVVPFSATNGR
jgi:hypothetical protein